MMKVKARYPLSSILKPKVRSKYSSRYLEIMASNTCFEKADTYNVPLCVA